MKIDNVKNIADDHNSDLSLDIARDECTKLKFSGQVMLVGKRDADGFFPYATVGCSSFLHNPNAYRKVR